MVVPAVFKFVNWITGTPVPIDDAITSALTPTVDSALSTALSNFIFGIVRERLLANRDYYVATTGSDSNNGLTPATPFLTLQKAMNVSSSLDLGVFNVTNNVADGTYTAGVDIKPWVGSGTIFFKGNVTTPANVKITVTGDDCFANNAGSLSGTFDISGFQLKTITSGFCILSRLPGRIQYTKIVFDTAPVAHVVSAFGSLIVGYGANEIIGSTIIHGLADTNGVIAWPATDVAAVVYTITGAPNFNVAFVQSGNAGAVSATGFSFVGAGATGKRYVVNVGSIIQTNGGGANYFPGNIAGTADAATFSVYA